MESEALHDTFLVGLVMYLVSPSVKAELKKKHEVLGVALSALCFVHAAHCEQRASAQPWHDPLAAVERMRLDALPG